jgi:hypothetical protein
MVNFFLNLSRIKITVTWYWEDVAAPGSDFFSLYCIRNPKTLCYGSGSGSGSNKKNNTASDHKF